MDEQLQKQLEEIEKQKCIAPKRQYQILKTEFFDISQEMLKFYPQIENPTERVFRTVLKRYKPEKTNTGGVTIHIPVGESGTKIKESKIKISSDVSWIDVLKDFYEIPGFKEQVRKLAMLTVLSHEMLHNFAKVEYRLLDERGKPLNLFQDINTPKASNGKIIQFLGGVPVVCFGLDQYGKIFVDQKEVEEETGAQIFRETKKKIVKNYNIKPYYDQDGVGRYGRLLHEGMTEFLTQKFFDGGGLKKYDNGLTNIPKVAEVIKNTYKQEVMLAKMLDALNPGDIEESYFKGKIYFSFKNLGTEIIKNYAQTQDISMAVRQDDDININSTIELGKTRLNRADECLAKIIKIMKNQDAQAKQLFEQGKISKQQLNNYLKTSKEYKNTFNNPSFWFGQIGVMYCNFQDVKDMVHKHFPQPKKKAVKKATPKTTKKQQAQKDSTKSF